MGRLCLRISQNPPDFMSNLPDFMKDQLPGMVRPMFGLSNERTILGDNPKAHNENHRGFHEKQQFS